MNNRILDADELAAIAKQFREASGKTQTEAARELGVSGAAMFQAEENPKQSLQKLRKRIIEAYSDCDVVGPVYILKTRG